MPKKANIFDSFSHSAIQQFKEAFGIMDADKDGLLSSSDLVAAFGAYGKNIGGGEAQVSFKTVSIIVNVKLKRGGKLAAVKTCNLLNLLSAFVHALIPPRLCSTRWTDP